MDIVASEEPNTTCRFDNRAINRFIEPLFRLDAENREPCLFFELDGRPAILPLHALASMVGIEDGSPDREMLRLVGLSLGFRRSIKLGDPLPSEIITGEPSWNISPHFRLAASTYVTLSVLRWQGGEQLLGPLDATMLTTSNPEIKGKVALLSDKAARSLELAGGARALNGLVGELASDLSFVDAGLDQLLSGLRKIASTLRKIGRGAPNVTTARREVCLRTLSLLLTEERRAKTIAAEVAIDGGNVEHALRAVSEARKGLRTARDLLFHTLVTWGDELKAWSGHVEVKDERIWTGVERLYRFAARNQVLSAAGPSGG